MKAHPRIYHEPGRIWLDRMNPKEDACTTTLAELESAFQSRIQWHEKPFNIQSGGIIGEIIGAYKSLCPVKIGLYKAESGPNGYPFTLIAFDNEHQSNPSSPITRSIVCFAECGGEVVPIYSDTFTD